MESCILIFDASEKQQITDFQKTKTYDDSYQTFPQLLEQ